MFKILYLLQTFVIHYDFTSCWVVSTPYIIHKLVCALYFVFKVVLSPF